MKTMTKLMLATFVFFASMNMALAAARTEAKAAPKISNGLESYMTLRDALKGYETWGIEAKTGLPCTVGVSTRASDGDDNTLFELTIWNAAKTDIKQTIYVHSLAQTTVSPNSVRAEGSDYDMDGTVLLKKVRTKLEVFVERLDNENGPDERATCVVPAKRISVGGVERTDG